MGQFGPYPFVLCKSYRHLGLPQQCCGVIEDGWRLRRHSPAHKSAIVTCINLVLKNVVLRTATQPHDCLRLNATPLYYR